MKQVELTEVKAMLSEIAATSSKWGDGSIVTVATSGNDPKRQQRELDGIVGVVKSALPAAHNGVIVIDDAAWHRLEQLYYQRVIRPLFL